ncbi:hypothetical protein F3Y22_tig00110634pilonHSYRG00020 [Hibiscus syriacus]|uniref:Uncharacterized protein n=1 Tax=Hibiscus syriacus TaxID=106335 RepID=A0A6A2ZZ62_HIBSY|nr:hypothetical protein F3Y22_tig00110634pilonHSYRG00020 [Hibiscus syriacus]
MSIDEKGIQHPLWKNITVSGSCCYRYVRKYPVVWGSLVFVFFLYTCFPLVFHYLLCSSPIIAFTFVSIRFYLKTKHPDSKWIKSNNSGKKSNVDVNRSNNPSLRNLKSVRRNARMEILEWDRKDSEELNSISPASPYGIASLFHEEMKMFSPRSPYGPASLFNDPNFLDENPESVFDDKGRNSMEHGGGSSFNIKTKNDRALPKSQLSDSFQRQSGREEMNRFSPRSPYGHRSLFSVPNFSDENSESVFAEKGSNSMEHRGSSFNIKEKNDQALHGTKSRFSNSFQQQSGREEMNRFSPRSPYGLASLFSDPNLDENPESVFDEKGRNSMEHGGSSFNIKTKNDRALRGRKSRFSDSFQQQIGREETNSDSNFSDENSKSIFDEEGRNDMEHGGSSSNIETANDRALAEMNSRLSDNFQEQTGWEEMDKFSPRTPYGIANLFREEMKMFSPRSPYGLARLFSDRNFFDENPKSIFDEEGRNDMEHGGSSSNIESENDRALDNTNCLSSDRFQEQSEREEMDRFSPRTPYGIANLFREEMKLFSPRSPYGLSSLFSNPNFLDESPKEVFDEKGRNSMEHGGSSSNVETENDCVLDNRNYLSSNSFQGQSGMGPNSGGQVELESMDKKHDGKKAAESTKDFQNNAMVLGTSESERNQRLESLMVKRRARKLVNMTVDKSVMNTDAILTSHLPPILTAKSNLRVSSNDRCKEILQMPGSAPSFSLPKENPFDLPYDPQEEKPNLMADSFQQEFMTANHKEFCRHESFRGGTFSTRDSNNCTQRSLMEGSTDPRFKLQSDRGGGHHHHNSSSMESDVDLVELDDSNHNNGMNSSERTTGGITIGETMGCHRDPEVRMDIGRNEVKMEIDSINNNDSCYTSDTESETSKSCRNQMPNNLNLLVPPKGRTVHSLPCYFNPSPNERPRSDFSLLCGTYWLNRPVSNCSLASDLQVEVSEFGSPPLATDVSVSSADGYSVSYDGDADKDINFDSEQVWGSSFNQSNGEKLKELHDIIKEDSVKVDASGLKKKLKKPNASPSPSEQEAKHVLNRKGSVASHLINKNTEAHEDTKNVDEKVDGLKTSNVPDKLSLENPEKIMHLMEKPITQRESSILDSKPSENRENGAEILVEAAREMKKPAETIGPGSTEHSHGNLETFYESKTPLESKKEIEGSHPSKYTEKGTRTLEPKHDSGDAPNAVQSRDILIGNNVSGPNQRFDGSSSMALNRRLVIEQIPEISFSSPRSVLPENVLEDEMSQSDVEQPQEDYTYNIPRNAQQLAENSMTQLSGNRSLGTLEKEPTNCSRKGTEEGSIGVNMKEAKSTTNQGESQLSIGLEEIQGPEKSNQHEDDVKNATANGSESTSIPQCTTEKEKSVAEVDRICNVNDSFAGNATDKEILNLGLDDEGESQILCRENTVPVVELSMVSGETSLQSVKDTTHGTEKLTEAKASANLSTSAGETNSSNNIKNGEEIQNLTGHDGIIDAPQSKEDNHNANNHNVSMEASKPTELEVKPVEPEGNGSNAVAE